MTTQMSAGGSGISGSGSGSGIRSLPTAMAELGVLGGPPPRPPSQQQQQPQPQPQPQPAATAALSLLEKYSTLQATMEDTRQATATCELDIQQTEQRIDKLLSHRQEMEGDAIQARTDHGRLLQELEAVMEECAEVEQEEADAVAAQEAAVVQQRVLLQQVRTHRQAFLQSRRQFRVTTCQRVAAIMASQQPQQSQQQPQTSSSVALSPFETQELKKQTARSSHATTTPSTPPSTALDDGLQRLLLQHGRGGSMLGGNHDTSDDPMATVWRYAPLMAYALASSSRNDDAAHIVDDQEARDNEDIAPSTPGAPPGAADDHDHHNLPASSSSSSATRMVEDYATFQEAIDYAKRRAAAQNMALPHAQARVHDVRAEVEDAQQQRDALAQNVDSQRAKQRTQEQQRASLQRQLDRIVKDVATLQGELEVVDRHRKRAEETIVVEAAPGGPRKASTSRSSGGAPPPRTMSHQKNGGTGRKRCRFDSASVSQEEEPTRRFPSSHQRTISRTESMEVASHTSARPAPAPDRTRKQNPYLRKKTNTSEIFAGSATASSLLKDGIEGKDDVDNSTSGVVGKRVSNDSGSERMDRPEQWSPSHHNTGSSRRGGITAANRRSRTTGRRKKTNHPKHSTREVSPMNPRSVVSSSYDESQQSHQQQQQQHQMSSNRPPRPQQYRPPPQQYPHRVGRRARSSHSFGVSLSLSNRHNDPVTTQDTSSFVPDNVRPQRYDSDDDDNAGDATHHSSLVSSLVATTTTTSHISKARRTSTGAAMAAATRSGTAGLDLFDTDSSEGGQEENEYFIDETRSKESTTLVRNDTLSMTPKEDRIIKEALPRPLVPMVSAVKTPNSIPGRPRLLRLAELAASSDDDGDEDALLSYVTFRKKKKKKK